MSTSGSFTTIPTSQSKETNQKQQQLACNIFIKIAFQELIQLGYVHDKNKSKNNSIFETVGLAIEQAQYLLDTQSNVSSLNHQQNQEQLSAAEHSENHSIDVYDGIFKPFMLILQENKTQPTILSLELLAKLFEYSYWNMNIPGMKGLIGIITDSIASCFVSELTDQKIQTLVLKALTAAISVNDVHACLHGSQMLKAVRVIYNIFLLSKSPTVQTVAQAALTQITSSIFNRVPTIHSYKAIMANHKDKICKRQRQNSSSSSSSVTQAMQKSSSKILADTDDHSGEFEEPTSFAHLISALGEKNPATRDSQEILRDAEAKADEKNFDTKESIHDVIAKDAYLLLRAYCKLAMKPIPDSGTDLKTQHMRSKILSLSLVFDIVKSFKHIFYYPAPILFTPAVQAESEDDVRFIVATKQYLCLSVTRNIVSIVPQVFDLSIDIFGRMMLDLRFLMKKQIGIMFIRIVIPIIEASTTVTFYQRVSCLRSLQRTFSRPEGGKLLVELYLNYDCDLSTGPDENIWERFIGALSQVMTGGSSLSDSSRETTNPQFSFTNSPFSIETGPAITTSNLQNYTKEQVRQLYLPTGDMMELKKRVAELLVKGILFSIYNYCQDQRKLEELKPVKLNLDMNDDQVTTFEISKNKKVRLAEGIKMFNQSPKKAIRFLVDAKVIPSKAPRHVAHFLLHCPGLDKVMIGEYLGEGDEINVQTMHAFVDLLDFSNMSFVDALRKFLNTFRLPGEAQKIDRSMLKFAARYLTGNPESFSSADTAYVLAYSTIMLNTDQYNPQVKNRMTCEDFVKNNRGIDEGKDLPLAFLERIFNEIKQAEIKMKDDASSTNQNSDLAPSKPKGNVGISSSNYGKSIQQDLYNNIKKHHGITRDTSSLDSALNVMESSNFVEVSHYGHVKPMFQLVWMSLLMVVSSTLQNATELNSIITSLEGFKYAIHLSCIFDLELEKKGFLTNIAKFLEVPNLLDCKEKNIETCKMLLEMAYIDGNSFHENWKMVVKCISDIEKIQSAGLIEPDPSKPSDQRKKDTRHIEEMFANISSQAVTLSIDRIFTNSAKLNATSIVQFTRALSDMSWEEIISSSDKEHPRMYCLQKLIEVCHYNVHTRIRIEWNQIWSTIGPHINQVGCHSNSNVVYFCLDKLRQFASKFLDLNELPNFKFQKDFLQPFLFIFENNPDVKIKDMVLTCINQMILQKASKLRSGWKTIFSILSSAAQEPTEAIVKLGFSISSTVHRDFLELVMSQGFYPDFVATLTKYCHCEKFPKINGQAVTMLCQGAERANQGKRAPLPPSNSVAGVNEDEEDPALKVWMVTFRNMKNVILTCDLEVRSKALTDFFEVLKQNGHQFNPTSWQVILSEIILPFFDLLNRDPDEQTLSEEVTVWMSTTLVSALKHLTELYTKFPLLTTIAINPLLDLLMKCILQDNDTLAKLGSSCVQFYIEQNCSVFTEADWDNICNRLVKLFEITRPNELFFELEYESEQEPVSHPLGLPFATMPVRKEYPRIIVKCVLHLLIIQTIHKIFICSKSDDIYGSLSQKHVFRLGDALYQSYIFAQGFNDHILLRHKLHQIGFMKQLPNLVKQETSSVSCYIILLSRMFSDKSPQQALISKEVERRLLPLSYHLLNQFLQYDVEKQQSTIAAWTPVVESILSGFLIFEDHHFQEYIPYFYSIFVRLIGRFYFHASLEPIFERIGFLYRIPQKNASFPKKIECFPSLDSVAQVELDKVADGLVEMSMRHSIASLQSYPEDDGKDIDPSLSSK